jgi:hypothetical protein
MRRFLPVLAVIVVSGLVPVLTAPSAQAHSGHSERHAVRTSGSGPHPQHVDPAPAGVNPKAPVSVSAAIRRAGVDDDVPVPLSGKVTRQAASATGSPLPVRSTTPPGRPGNDTLTEHVAPSCGGTGVDGKRVQVLYAYEGSTNRLDVVDASTGQTLRAALLSYVADVDDTFALSSPEAGRRVRWVFDPNTCVPVIKAVKVAAGVLAGTDAGLPAISAAAVAAGVPASDRKLLAFADRQDLCGLGEIYLDDTQSATNANNGSTSMVARVDRGCWAMWPGDASTAAHELMHMLGGVQSSAPNATSFGHCTDEWDVMCYADGGTVAGGAPAAMRVVCPVGSAALFDCGRNDYFYAGTPASGSYLAGHWNTARSSYLDGVVPAASPPAAVISGPSSLRPGLAGSLTASATEAGTVRWTADIDTCLVGSRTQRVARVQCPTSTVGPLTVTATFVTSGGATFADTHQLALSGPSTPLTVGLTAPQRVATRSSADLTARVRSGSAPVRAVLSAQQRVPAGSGWVWKQFATATATTAGTATVRTPAWSTTGARGYRLRVITTPASGWTATTSPTVSVTSVHRTTVTAAARTGRPSLVSARLRTRTGAALGSRWLTLQSRTSPSASWRTVSRAATNSTGTASARVRPGRPTSYRWVFASSTSLAGSISASVAVRY